MSHPAARDVAEPAPRRRILLADDEATLLRLMARILKDAGFLVETASDGAIAATMARQGEYDVVVSDIHMPGLDGLGLLRAIREHDLDVPVILLSGAPDVETASRAVEFGAFRYLVKKNAAEAAALVRVVHEAARTHDVARLKRSVLELHGGAFTQPADRSGLEVSLDRAVEKLWMAYQPIVSWSGQRTLAYEALVRTDEPTLPNPGVLLDAAERTGRLLELGRAIRARVAGDVVSAPADLVFVNLHPRDLQDESLYDPNAPLSRVAARVTLELTERASLEDVDGLNERVADLRALGYRIAVDDLGAGYAGLSSLARLEPEFVKLDMSLVRDIDRQPLQQKLVRSVVLLCQEIGKSVVAEGIETPNERAALLACGCDLLQGYLIAKPGRGFPTPNFR